ncbi:hypothetical protein OIU78_002230 [Salix suchowensis]|nr:hypothetical protein OIU78_002230 [Salix suchowensis]
MATEKDLLSTEIVSNGIESSGPNAGSLTFSVRVRRRLPDFLQSVNLKYVKLGYHYLINHAIYLVTIPVLVVVFSAELGSLSKEELWKKLWEDARYDLATVLASFAVLVFTVSVHFMSRPRSIYLIDFACYRPDDDLKVTKDQFIEQARKSGKFDRDMLQANPNNYAVRCIYQDEDEQKFKGLKVSKDLVEIGGEALKTNITTLGPLVLPFSEQLLFFTTLIWRHLFGNSKGSPSSSPARVRKPSRNNPWLDSIDRYPVHL